MTDAPPPVPQSPLPELVPAPAGLPEKLALTLLQAGAVATVLVAATFRTFELDRFFVPKELVLHACAALAALFALRAFGRARAARADTLLAVFLLLSAISAALATNVWLGMRALAVSISSVALFWTARALREAGLGRPLVHALGFAVVVAAATSLAQTYGLDLLIFSENRAPGGTLGNRNFIAHAAAFGFPILLAGALGARTRRGFVLGAIGAAASTSCLVLTRSRAGWLAFAVVMAAVVFSMLAARALRRDGRTWRRLVTLLLIAGAAVGAALLLPNSLKWRSDNPYLETVRRVADYEGGSGRGRLIQYGRSLAMTARHPLFGVGPGNWPVEYPGSVPPSDRSLSDSEPGTTFNPWPSSDWIAWISERGFAAAAVLGLVFLALTAGALRQLTAAADADEGLTALALLGTIAGAGVTGAFDAVLMTAVPAFLVWTALGALWVPPGDRHASRLGLLVVALLAAGGAVRSGAQLAAMQIYSSYGDRASLERAAAIDPGNYRVQLRLARVGSRSTRCGHAEAAHDLLPHAKAAADAARRCR